MLRRLLFALAAVSFLLPSPALSQMLQAIVAAPSVAPSTYTGPIDIVASPSALYSLRAGSAAIATTGTQAIVDLRRKSDNATCTATIAASGGALDLTVKTPCNSSTQTVMAWLNNASSVTGTIATTVFTVTACSACNLAVGLPITGAGVTAGTVILSLGTGTGGIGTYNINISQTESVGETMTAPAYAYVSKWYDQSGNGNGVVQAAAAAQPLLLLSGGVTSGSPGLSFSGGQNLLTAGSFTQALPVFLSTVAVRSGALTSFSWSVSALGPELGFTNSTNTAGLLSTVGTISATAADLAWHAMQGVANGTSPASSLMVDGASTPGTLTGGIGNKIAIGSNSNGIQMLTGQVFEVGVWYSAPSAGTQTSLNTNQHAIGGGW